MDVNKIVGALKYLEGKLGANPTTKELAEECGCSEATAIKYLKKALDQNLIAQRGERYMSLSIARAYDAQKD